MSCKEKDGDLCSFCNVNAIPVPPTATRRPYPDYTRLPKYHYRSWEDTPTNALVPDDFQPRAQIKALFENGKLSTSNTEAVKDFCSKYIVPEKFVIEYLQHITSIKIRKDKSLAEDKKKREERATKNYNDFDWLKLYDENKLSTLLLRELNLYIDHHDLDSPGDKKANIKLIKAHIGNKYMSDRSVVNNFENQEEESSDENTSNSDEDEVTAVIGSSDTSESEVDMVMEQPSTSRYGRKRSHQRQEGCVPWNNIVFS